VEAPEESTSEGLVQGPYAT